MVLIRNDSNDTETSMKQHPEISVTLRLGGSLLLGSIPFSNIIARCTAGYDLRTVGTGTVSSTSVYRLARPWTVRDGLPSRPGKGCDGGCAGKTSPPGSGGRGRRIDCNRT